MAIELSTEYPAQVDTSNPSGYPHGAARDDAIPGDGQGTPLQKTWVNDLYGFFAAILKRGSVAPSGAPDSAITSQYWDALKWGLLGELQVANYTDYNIGTASATVYTGNLNSICYAHELDRYVAVGDYSAGDTAVFYSSDLITWTRTATVSGISNLYDVCWSGLKFYAVGTGGKIIGSSDGITWAIEPAGSGYVGDFYGVAAVSATKIIAAGFSVITGGELQISSGGGSWTQATLPGTDRLYCCCASPKYNKFYLAGQNGKIISGLYGLTGWAYESAADGFTGDWLSIDASPFSGEVLIGGASATIQHSFGAGSWVTRTPETVGATAFAGNYTLVKRMDAVGKWLVGGNTGGELQASSDGIAFRRVRQNAAWPYLSAGAAGGGGLALVGNGGGVHVGLRG